MARRIERRKDREELAAFLRARRARLSPEDVGLPRGSRRRIKGLRREEVARLSGVSATWYTWLEQAKNIQVSGHFLERLAKALKLDAAEKKHLFLSCQLPLPERVDTKPVQINEDLRRMLETISSPAYVQTHQWDVLYLNAPAVAMWGDLSWIPPHRRNVLRSAFLDEHTRSIIMDWHRWAPKLVARFRLDAAAILTTPEVVQLIEELKSESPEFREWWANPQVVGRDEEPRSYMHPIAGKLVFSPMTLTVDHFPGLKIRVLTPHDSGTADKMRRLVSQLRARPLDDAPSADHELRRQRFRFDQDTGSRSPGKSPHAG